MSDRCVGCPVRELIACPAVAGIHRPPVRHYCERRAADPETWDPAIVATAELDAAGGPVHVPLDASARPGDASGAFADLTAEQLRSAETCTHKRRVPHDCCAGWADVCGQKYHDGRPLTIACCAECLRRGWPRD